MLIQFLTDRKPIVPTEQTNKHGARECTLKDNVSCTQSCLFCRKFSHNTCMADIVVVGRLATVKCFKIDLLSFLFPRLEVKENRGMPTRPLAEG